ncbi:putative zinc finger protein, partial [Orchesella cincta]
MVHGETKRFPCKQCRSSFHTPSALTRHIKDIHDPSYIFTIKCAICDKGFHTNYNHQSHMRTHTNEKPYSCSVCRNTFTHPTSLKNHMKRIHSTVKVNPFSCLFCDKRFYGSYSQPHKRTTKGFHWKHYLVVHTNRVHSGEKRFQCVFCEKLLTERSYLSSHIRGNHISNEKPYFCKECRASFYRPGTLTEHIRKIHEDKDPKPFKCILCKRGFPTNTHMLYHLRVHTGEKPYPCAVCGKRFHLKSILDRHSKIHK